MSSHKQTEQQHVEDLQEAVGSSSKWELVRIDKEKVHSP